MRVRRRWLAIGLSVWMSGCATVRHRADQAFSRGDYLAAASLYEKVVAAHPDDESAKRRLQSAREGALGTMLADARSARATWHDEAAMTALGVLLAQRDAWKIVLPAAIAPSVETEIRADSAWLRVSIEDTLASAGPLGAETAVAKWNAVLAEPELAAFAVALHATIAAQGASVCETLSAQTTPDAPYATWLVDRYCDHWGAAGPAAIPLPHLRSPPVAVDGGVDGAATDELAAFRSAVRDGFRASVWFGASAPAARAKLEGDAGLSFDRRDVLLSAPWTERVAYTRTETYQEPYHESYWDTETYTESVPSTEYQTVYVPCGDSTCPEQQAVTVWHDETRTRQVLKTRTAYRDATREVIDYVDEPRVFEYWAEENLEYWSSHLDVALADPAANTQVDYEDSASGYYHQVTFEPAGVYPADDPLPGRGAFVNGEAADLRAAVTKALDGRYRELECARASYTLDQAAACAYLDPAHLPGAALEALRAPFGEDRAAVGAVLHR